MVTIFVRKGWWSIFRSNWQYQGGHTSWIFLSLGAIDINTILGRHICAVFDAITICTMQRCLVCFWNMVWRRQFIFCCAWRSHVVNMRNQRNCVKVNMCVCPENIEWVLLVNSCTYYMYKNDISIILVSVPNPALEGQHKKVINSDLM